MTARAWRSNPQVTDDEEPARSIEHTVLDNTHALVEAGALEPGDFWAVIQSKVKQQ